MFISKSHIINVTLLVDYYLFVLSTYAPF